MNKIYLTAIIILLSVTHLSTTAVAQPERNSGFDIDIDPIAYTLNGFSIHGGYTTGAWRFDLGMFGLDIPEWLHGNENFEASFIGAGWKVDRFFKGHADGFFAGIEGNISRMDVTHKASNSDKDQVGTSIGIRGGYRWNPGLGKLFVTPWMSLGYNINSKDIVIEGDSFEATDFQLFPTVHIGWAF